MKRSLVFLLTLVFTCSVFFSVVATGAKPGDVKVTTITGEIVKINPGVPYNREMTAIKTAKATYILRGSTKDIEKYIGCKAQMKGSIVAGPQGITFFVVESYKITKITKATPSVKPTIAVTKLPTKSPIPTVIKTVTPSYTPGPNPSAPRNDILVGWLGILDPAKPRLLLKTEKGVAYELMGEIKGLEKLEGRKLEVTGSYVYTLVATEFPLFSVISYKVYEEPVPTVAPNTVIITEKDNGGYVYVKKGDVVKLSLESNKTTGYSWNIDEYFDKTILLQTGYEYIVAQKDATRDGAGGREVWTYSAVGAGSTVTYLSYIRPWESVPANKTFKVKVIVDGLPTPTPSYDVLKGFLSVTRIEPVDADTAASGYNFSLKTEKGPFTLQGNVKGLEQYNGAEIEVTGTISPLKINPPIFNVVSYVIITKPTVPPTPTPPYVVLKGLLGVTEIIPVDTDMIASGYKFSLKTESSPFTLQGNVKGLEKYDGAEIEVTGTISPLDIYPPIFNVVSYVIISTPTPPPTPTPSGKTHTILSDKALYVSDPTLGITTANARGNVTISWTDNTQNAFFKAKVFIPDMTREANYEFELIQTRMCDSDSIVGIFNITRNGRLVAERIAGELYGLNAPVGEYFKFYSEGYKWHLSAYVTSRIDF